MIAFILQIPTDPIGYYKSIAALGPVFLVMSYFLYFVIAQNAELRKEIKQCNDTKDANLKEVIPVLNKSSFVIENLPANLKTNIRDAIREEHKANSET